MKRKSTAKTASVLAALLLLAGGIWLGVRITPKQVVAKVEEFTHAGPLKIGLIPEKNVFAQKQRYKRIANYLSQNLGHPVQITLMDDYAEIYRAFEEGKLDAGFFGSFSYAVANERGLVEPIARPVWKNNSSTYTGYLFVRKDSDIKTVDDMKGKVLALVHRATTAGYLFQLSYFKEHGIADMKEHFSEIIFCGSHDAAAWAVYSGEADVGGAKNHIFNSLKQDKQEFADQMHVLAESAPVPSNGLAVRKDLDSILKGQIKDLLLGMSQTPAGREVLDDFGARKFIDTTNRDYSPLYEMIRNVGIDLGYY